MLRLPFPFIPSKCKRGFDDHSRLCCAFVEADALEAKSPQPHAGALVLWQWKIICMIFRAPWCRTRCSGKISQKLACLKLPKVLVKKTPDTFHFEKCKYSYIYKYIYKNNCIPVLILRSKEAGYTKDSLLCQLSGCSFYCHIRDHSLIVGPNFCVKERADG